MSFIHLKMKFCSARTTISGPFAICVGRPAMAF
jgi:hypothetical protein